MLFLKAYLVGVLTSQPPESHQALEHLEQPRGGGDDNNTIPLQPRLHSSPSPQESSPCRVLPQGLGGKHDSQQRLSSQSEHLLT